MLYNFKNVLILGTAQIETQQIKTNSNAKAIYQMEEKIAQQFVAKYPIFKATEKPLETKSVPLLAFKESDLKGHHESDSGFEIFVHA